ncbi:calcium-binding protein [Pseudomonas sp. HS6]|uniref:calcium-binding protein n=1 Tax=Pseudomonas sp. HS6 TaxID=2850559 RepID=UPI002018615C|nr:calcium-binding protein [Pseudomonas sp. HS6]UQS15390.1 calcium-binding protein [Pseudomonas sp. HS6]
MSYIFSDLEKSEILQAANICEGMKFNVEEEEYFAMAVEGRNCAVLYRTLSNILGGKFLGGSAFDESVMGIFKDAKLWLDVAIDANGGVGAYSALIRAYTLRQGELRLNKKISDSKMQQSSNQVAVNLMNTLIKGSVEHDLAPWTVPSISQIAEIDASAIGKVLFREDVGDIDTATSRNAGWSGTIGFSLLGGERPYETWRLISAGDPDSHIKGNHGLARFNRLDDLKNILFAVDSYGMALQAVIKNFGLNMVESLFSVLPEQINIALASGSINPLIQHVVRGTPISPIVRLILRYNLNDFFDMLRRTYDGNSAATPTTDETFVSNAYTFFSALSPAQSQSIVTRTIGEYGSASDWAKLAAQATPIGVALRNSLQQLSEVVIERSDGFSGHGLELYDPETGEGFITEQWLADRSEMLARLISRTNGSFGRNTVQTFSYSDLASGKQAPMTTGVANPLVMFGDDGGRSFGGGANTDHLYGGGGNDSISGLSGNDVIQAGSGNDSITGDEGNDALYGMAGNDVLVGGRGDDFLAGGSGKDRYEFSSGDGIDEIFEADVEGALLINGLPIPPLERSAPLSNIWLTEDRAISLTLIEDQAENTLNIKYGLSDLIVVKNFKPGMLGIDLPDYQDQTFPAPDLVLQGDWKVKDNDPNVRGDQPSYDQLGNALLMPNVKQRNKADLLYGSPKDDLIVGLGGSDRLFGKEGNDRLFGYKQSTLEKALADTAKGKNSRGDWLDGGPGDDLLVGTASRDVLLGGNGRDTLIGGAGDDNLSGDEATGMLEQNWEYKRVNVLIPGGITSMRTVFDNASLNKTLEGGNDVLYGQGGRDFINGGGGDDLLDGGSEDDMLAGEGGNDTLSGGTGNDTLFGDNLDWGGGLHSRHHGNDLLEGGSGDDALAGNGGSDVLYGGSGNDVLNGDDDVLRGISGDAAHFFGSDFLDGGAGNDTLWGGGAGDSLFGGSGNDDLAGDYPDHPIHYHGDDFLDGGTGDDTLRGFGGSDTLIGGAGADALDGDAHELQAGGTNNDQIRGDAGNDTLWGGLGADTLFGGADDDILMGDYEQTSEEEHGADYLDGGSGNDTLLGGGGNDTLVGGEGVDYLRGGRGDNVFDGGAGNDYLEGMQGNDVFYFGVGDGLDVVTDTGGNNVVSFGDGFSAENLQAKIVNLEAGTALRLSNGFGDALLIRHHEKWAGSTFRFNDGVILNFQDVIKLTVQPADVTDPSATIAAVPDPEKKQDIESESEAVVQTLPDDLAASTEREDSDAGHHTAWHILFLSELKAKRSADRQASGFALNEQGVWVRSHIATDESGYAISAELIHEDVEVGVFSKTPEWMGAIAADAVVSERQSIFATKTTFKFVKTEAAQLPEQKPKYYPSGSSYSGFSFNLGDAVVEDIDQMGAIQGWYVYPAGSFENHETVRKAFRWSFTTQTIKHKVVHGNDAGGRVNLEVGNLFHGGAGDDLVVTYAGSVLEYGGGNDRIPGAFLSAGAGNDTLLGSAGADYLISGPGEDRLYGENGPDTYIVEAHDGATTIIADVLDPVFLRPEVGDSGWHEELGALDMDTVVLPEEANPDKLQLTWGAVLVEVVNIELLPVPTQGAYRQPPRAQMLYTTLNITWGGSQTVRIVLPNPNDLSGSGIERVRFSDGSNISLKDLVSRLGNAPDTYQHGITVQGAAQVKSFRDNLFLPLVGGRGNDTLNGAGEIKGMQGDDLLGGGSGDDVIYGGPGNDTLSGGGGNDVYKYDGLGRDLVVNAGGGTDGIDFSEVGLSIDQLKFHRERDDLVIVVSYGMSPKIRVSEHFSGGDAAISFIRVQGEEGAVKNYTANQLAELLHPLPPLRDVEGLLSRNDEESLQAMKEIIEFYELNV